VSLNFWEDDLKRFEVVSDLEAAVRSKKKAKPERPASPQMQLPFSENDVLGVLSGLES
jgi:hypothetical protein